VAAAHVAQAGDVSLGHQDSAICGAVLARTSCSDAPVSALLDVAVASFKVITHRPRARHLLCSCAWGGRRCEWIATALCCNTVVVEARAGPALT
jgi:hypothetical protein